MLNKAQCDQVLDINKLQKIWDEEVVIWSETLSRSFDRQAEENNKSLTWKRLRRSRVGGGGGGNGIALLFL
jgi:hypothetical protein